MMSLTDSTPSWSTAAWVVVALGIGTLLLLACREERNLPPGPRRLPLIGNVHHVPLAFPERRFAEWRKQYGV